MKKLKEWSMRFTAFMLSSVMALSSPISVMSNVYANTHTSEDSSFVFTDSNATESVENMRTTEDSWLENEDEPDGVTSTAANAVMLMNEVYIESIEIVSKSPSTIYLGVGDTYELDVNVLPADATESVVYGSYDENILTVDEDGVVTAVGTGSASVYAESASGSHRTSFYMWVVDESVTVTLNANGGIFENEEDEVSFYVESGDYFALYAWEPTREGKAFTGNWYAEPECETLVVEETYFYPEEDVELYAEWANGYEITFDYNGVTYNGETSAVYQIVEGECIDSNYPYIPTDPSQTGNKLFTGWKTEDGEILSVSDFWDYEPMGDETLTAVWSDYYTIYFDYNGVESGYESGSTFYVVQGEEVTYVPYLPELNPNDSSLIYAGWETEDGEIIDKNEVYAYVPDSDETLKAVWSPYYTVTLDVNGGSFKYSSQKSEIRVAEGFAVSNLPSSYSITKTGYIFSGWYEKDTDILAESGEYIPTDDVTLVAKWSEYWTLTFDANGGTCLNSYYTSRQVEKGGRLYLPSDYAFSNGTYSLAGWCEDQEGTGTVYTGYYTPTADTTLYAKWVGSYFITLDAGEGYFDNDPDETTRVEKIAEGQAVGWNIESTDWTPKSEDGGFAGWYLDQECTIPVKRTYVPTSDVTFYAKWNEYYTVTIHAGGPYYYDHDDLVSEAEIKIPVGNEIGDIDYFERYGYIANLYLDENYTLPYDSMYVPEGDCDVYVEWVKEIVITWNAAGGKTQYGYSSGQEYIGAGSSAYLPVAAEISKEGYAFAGWFTADGVQVDNTTIFYENTSVTAKWVEGYKVTIDLNGGTLPYNYGSRYTPYSYVQSGEELGLYYNPQKSGAAFLEWTDESGNSYSMLDEVIITKDTTFTAQWTSGYAVTLHAGEGIIYNGIAQTYVEEMTVMVPTGTGKGASTILSTSATSNEGNTKVGWALTEDGEALDLYSYSFTKDTDLYVVWKPAANIIFVANGGIYYTDEYAPTISIRCVIGNTLNYPRDVDMSRKGYTFAGWYKNADFTGDRIYIPDSKYVVTGHDVFYAKWERVEGSLFIVTFDSQGGSAVSSQEIEVGATARKPVNPTNGNMTFTGWYTEADCQNLYDFTSAVTEDITLYAGWADSESLSTAVVTVNGTYTYNGSMIVPDLTVKKNGTVLTKDKDYTVSGGGVNAGENTVTITAIDGSGYTGTQTVTFTIEKAVQENVEVPDLIFWMRTYGSTLGECGLQDGWSWKDGDDALVGPVGCNKFTVIYNPDPINYVDYEATATVWVDSVCVDSDEIEITVLGGPFVYTGQEIEPEISVELKGETLTESEYTVYYSNNVNASSHAQVGVTVDSNYCGTNFTYFTIEKGDPALEFAGAVFQVTYGQTLASVVPALTTGWKWQDGQTVGNVTKNGYTTFLADYTTFEGSNYASGNDIALNVAVQARSIASSGIKVELEQDSYTYTGQPIEPTVTVTDSGLASGVATVLVQGTDYTVSYSQNEDVGEGCVTITGLGNYTGASYAAFSILGDEYDVSTAEVTLSVTETDYTGSEICPTVTVVIGDKTLTKNTDYTVAYSNNVLPGYGTVTITGTGTFGTDTYYSEKEVYFLIHAADYELNAVYGEKLQDVELPYGWTWQGTDEPVGDVTDEWPNIFLATYSANGLVKKNEEFKVYVSARNINDSVINVETEEKTTEYYVNVTVTDTKRGKVLTAGVDYTVGYNNNDGLGTAQVIIKGIGNYTGTITRNFEIVLLERNLMIETDKLVDGKFVLTEEDEAFYLYTSYRGTWDGTITFSSSNENVFKVTQTTNDCGNAYDALLTVCGAGKATLTISVSEGFSYEAAKLTFEVIVEGDGIDISGAEVQKENLLVYTGEALEPEVTVVLNGETLVKDVDYVVAYSNNINAGTADITITGINSYTGTIETDFEIDCAPTTINIWGRNVITVNFTDEIFGLFGESSTGVDLIYTSTNNNVVWPDNCGTVTITGPGTAEIHIEAPASANHYAGSLIVYVTVIDDRISDGWVETENGTMYYKNNAAVKESFIKVDGYYYYLDANGYMVTNEWVGTTIGDYFRWRYMTSSGKAECSDTFELTEIDGELYAFDEEGLMLVGWVISSENRCLEDDEYKRWKEADYYFEPNWKTGGRLVTGWQRIGVYGGYEDPEQTIDNWFYFSQNEETIGKKSVGLATDLDNKLYYFDENGCMWHDTEVTVDGVTYVLDSNGVATVKAAEQFAITSYPESVTADAGCKVTFAVEASGTGLTYQWQYQLDGKENWSKWSTKTASSMTLTVSSVYHNAKVRCVVTDENGNVLTSNAATVTVNGMDELKITKHPESVVVEEGSRAYFSVEANGTDLSYQWQYKLAGKEIWSQWSSKTASSMSLSVTDFYNGSEVRCVVTDGIGNVKISDSARVEISGKEISFAIISHPESVAYDEGMKASFAVEASGFGLSYQWQYKLAGKENWSKWSTKTASSMKLTVSEFYNGAEVRCVVTNSDGETLVSNSAIVTIIGKEIPFEITSQPTDVTTEIGAKAKFVVSATGIGLGYQWQYMLAGKENWSKWSSKTSSSMSLTASEFYDGAKIRCIVTDAYGNELISDEVLLSVENN